MSRFLLRIAYDGTDFAGWQRQAGPRTVQGEIEAALGRIVGAPVAVHGAGRTDAGVHALGQCAHFDVPERFARVPWRLALNSIMAADVRVTAAASAPSGFHAQFSAHSKTYAYTLWLERAYVDPLRRRFVWDVPPLDLAAMDAAAVHFVGEHDFESFRNSGSPVGRRGTVRTVKALRRSPGATPAEVVWRITADGFLKQMVRNIVGCLVAVGKGKVPAEAVPAIFARRDRNNSLPTAPARGLCMERVDYGEWAGEAVSRPVATGANVSAAADCAVFV